MTLQEFFEKYNRVALAFSGGVDSAYLLYAAAKYATRVKAYYVRSAFQPQFEYDDAIRLISDIRDMGLEVELQVIDVDIFADEQVVANPDNRCYYCKQSIFGAIQEAAALDDFDVIIDGTNASDDYDDRPGMKALQEMEVLSPLRLCGLTKDDVRKYSKEVGLFTWDKPSYACLATRIPANQRITREDLDRTEWAEDYLHELGFLDCRVRLRGDAAQLEINEEQMDVFEKKKEEIYTHLMLKYDEVLDDVKCRFYTKK
ncbi:MAG: ATP-dependent sacrificial sulfur transferase LarE [Lachnospiraceae bacterium]|nr:ATP-dependent sacrificial sulfur transferase LarE [Lachnospiraceae bacterium]